jgi:hypothetical protein
VPQSRLFSLMGLTKREQIKFGDNPTFPAGTEPLRDEQGKLIGYRIKKGVLGIREERGKGSSVIFAVLPGLQRKSAHLHLPAALSR